MQQNKNTAGLKRQAEIKSVNQELLDSIVTLIEAVNALRYQYCMKKFRNNQQSVQVYFNPL
jgi:hypothetical protein